MGCAKTVAGFRTPFFIAACALSVGSAFVLGCSNSAVRDRGGFEEIAFTTSDGFELVGDLRHVAAENPQGLILVHMLGSDRTAWVHFMERAARAGYLTLAYDIRGHGDSTTHAGEKVSFRAFGKAEWRAALADIAAAKNALLAAGADPGNIALVGASIGANLSLIYAANDPQIQAVVMLSPGQTFHGLETGPSMQRFRERPTLIVATEGDTYSASSSAALKAMAPGFCELRMYAGSAHGTDILAADRNSEGQIFQWLEGILREDPPAGTR